MYSLWARVYHIYVRSVRVTLEKERKNNILNNSAVNLRRSTKTKNSGFEWNLIFLFSHTRPVNYSVFTVGLDFLSPTGLHTFPYVLWTQSTSRKKLEEELVPLQWPSLWPSSECIQHCEINSKEPHKAARTNSFIDAQCRRKTDVKS